MYAFSGNARRCSMWEATVKERRVASASVADQGQRLVLAPMRKFLVTDSG